MSKTIDAVREAIEKVKLSGVDPKYIYLGPAIYDKLMKECMEYGVMKFVNQDGGTGDRVLGYPVEIRWDMRPEQIYIADKEMHYPRFTLKNTPKEERGK